MQKKPYIGLDQKVVFSVMKKFLSGKKADDDKVKFFKWSDGVDYSATNIGSAIHIFMKNKREARDGTVSFVQPQANGKYEELKEIFDYPNVEKLFDIDFNSKFEVMIDDIPDFINIHEVISKAGKIGSGEGVTKLTINDDIAELDYSDGISINYNAKIKNVHNKNLHDFHYDSELMLAIFKSLKDLKVEKVSLFFESNLSPLYFRSEDTQYIYYFALARKLSREKT